MKAILGFYLMALFTSPSFAAELVHKGKAAPLPQGSERPNAKAAGEVDLILKVPEGLKTIEELHAWLQTLNLPEGEVVVKLGAHWCPPYQTTKGWFTSANSIGFLGTEASPNLLSDFSDTVTILPFETVFGNFGSAGTGTLGGSLASGFFSEYLGSGTFNIVVNALQSTSVEGPGIDQSTSSPRLGGNVVVTYEIVPEPSTASLIVLGLGGLAGLRRARRI